MSKKKKIFLFILAVLILDISYTATVLGYDNFFRFGPVFSYIEDVTCNSAGGKMSEFSHNCRTERKCFLLYKDGGKPCQNSNDCLGKCVLSDLEIALYCSKDSGPRDLFSHSYCPGLTGKCEAYYNQRNFDYNNGVLEHDWSGSCTL